MAMNQLDDVLKKNNIHVIFPLGEDFDPTQHNSVDIVPVKDAKDNNKIIEVVRVGYSLGDTVLRVADVKVGIKKK